MYLERLCIRSHEKWSTKEISYTGDIEVKGKTGTISLHLTPDMIKKIVKVCAESLVEVAKEAARDLTMECIELKKEVSTQNVNSLE